mmetsp:Transcript_30929/g.59729  ORF Transcript_30929/g.59729 Transcript_30929/m.59729 type:complete len:382 (+) Transcript_30929:85-1230(+)
MLACREPREVNSMAFGTSRPSYRLPCRMKPVRPATTSVLLLMLTVLVAWLCASGQATLLCVRMCFGKSTTDATNRPREDHPGESFSRLLNVPLVELRVLEGMPWRVVKVLAPILPEVAQWWTEADAAGFSASIEGSQNRNVKVRVEIASGEPLRLNGGAGIRAVHSALDLPEDAVIEDCQVRPVQVAAEVKPLSSLGQIRALLVVCPVRGSKKVDAVHAHRGPMKLLTPPVWLLLLLPLVLNTSAGGVSLLGGVCLMMASMICFSLALTLVAVAVQRQCTAFVQRWKRLFRLKTLDKQPCSVEAVFGAYDACCICLEQPEECKPEELKRIVLLPCRHAVHRDCYTRWVCADAYPSEDLICPLCRGRAEAIGKFVSVDQIEP